MSSNNWVEVAVRILDYCQTRDAFLRASEVSPELVHIWAEELARTKQPEPVLQEAAANVYRNAGGKPPADPIGAITSEARELAKSQAKHGTLDYLAVQQADATRELEGTTTRGPIHSTYQVQNAIDHTCADVAGPFGGTQHGCGSPAGAFCIQQDGTPRRTPHPARLRIGWNHLTDDQKQATREEAPTYNPKLDPRKTHTYSR